MDSDEVIGEKDRVMDRIRNGRGSKNPTCDTFLFYHSTPSLSSFFVFCVRVLYKGEKI